MVCALSVLVKLHLKGVKLTPKATLVFVHSLRSLWHHEILKAAKGIQPTLLYDIIRQSVSLKKGTRR